MRIDIRASGQDAADVPNAQPGSYVRRVDCLVRHVGDVVVLLPIGAHEAITLTGSAAAIWHELHQPKSERSVVEGLAESFCVSAADIRESVVQVLEELNRRGAVERAPG